MKASDETFVDNSFITHFNLLIKRLKKNTFVYIKTRE